MVRVPFELKTGVMCLLFFVCGCGSSTVPELPSSVFQLRTIGAAYGKATTELDRPPQNKEELMLYLKDAAKGYDNPADILRSKVDGEEFVIHWGVDNRNAPPKPDDIPVLAYEKHGQGGKRAVLQYRSVKIVTDEKFSEMPFPPPYKAPL